MLPIESSILGTGAAMLDNGPNSPIDNLIKGYDPTSPSAPTRLWEQTTKFWRSSGIGARDRDRAGDSMKKIEAIIQPFKLDEVKAAMEALGVDGMTITEVRGHGRQKGHKEVYRGQEYNVDLLPKVKVELVVPSERTDEILNTIIAAARTGKIGDGKIFVYEVQEAIRIRNDDRGESAI